MGAGATMGAMVPAMGARPVHDAELDALCMDHVGAGPTTPSSRDGRRDSDGGSGEQSCREARNKSEKARRDRVSNFINQLVTYLPILKGYGKKADKITILRVGANQVRMYKTSEQVYLAHGADVPAEIGEPLENMICEELNALFFVVNAAAKIVYVSKCEQHLGHTQVELFGQDMKKLIHKDDVEAFTSALKPDGDPQRTLLSIGLDDSSSDDTGTSTSMSSGQSSPPPTPSEVDVPRLKSERQMRNLRIRMQQKPVSRSDSPHFISMDLKGFIEVPAKLTVAGLAAAASQRSRGHRRKSTDNGPDEDVVFCFLASIVEPVAQITPFYSRPLNKYEYRTRHDCNGLIMHTDERIAFISGWLPSEVIGKNAFEYMAPDDRKIADIALQFMIENRLNGGSVYRLRTAAGGFVHLRTQGFLEAMEAIKDAQNSSEEAKQLLTFTCVNSLIDANEYNAEISALRRKFEPHLLAQLAGRSRATITELDEGADTSKQEVVRSSTTDHHGRASVLQMAGGDVRRGRKRITEGDSRSFNKRVCPSSPGVSGPSVPCASEGFSALPSGHDLHHLAGSSVIPDGVLASPGGHLAVLNQVQSPIHGLDQIFPNGILGRPDTIDQTAPAQAFPTESLTNNLFPEQDFPDTISILPEGCLGSLDTQDNPVNSDLLQQQYQLGDSLEAQQQAMSHQQQMLDNIPQSYPGLKVMKKELNKVKEEHQKQERRFQELHQTTIQHTQNLGSVNT